MLCRLKTLLGVSLIVASVLLVSGLCLCIASLDHYAFGLYFVLIAIVGYILAFSFCVVEPEKRGELTIAKEMWSKAQKSLRRPLRSEVGREGKELGGPSSTDSSDSLSEAASDPADHKDHLAGLALSQQRLRQKLQEANRRDFGDHHAFPSQPPVVGFRDAAPPAISVSLFDDHKPTLVTATETSSAPKLQLLLSNV